MKGSTVLLLLLSFLSPGLADNQVTAQAVVKTLSRTLNKTHSFSIKDSVEYYVKFTLSQKIIKKLLQNEKDKYIFQVNLIF